jgi:hypothetical protein
VRVSRAFEVSDFEIETLIEASQPATRCVLGTSPHLAASQHR